MGKLKVPVASNALGNDPDTVVRLAGRLVADLDGKTVRLHDGTRAGGRALASRIVEVDSFHHAADADDTNAFTRAIAALVATGGEIRLDPTKRYSVSASMTISSLFHICIKGGNFGQVYDANGPGITYTSAINSVFRVQAPAARGLHGGVSFLNISFYDSSGSGGAPGGNTIANGVLDLFDACMSVVKDCHFHFVKGSAIKTDFFVMSSIKGCRFRYCGVTGKKVVHLGSTDASYLSQSVIIHDCRFEVNYGDAYLFTDARAGNVTVSHCGFESGGGTYPTSNTTHLDIGGQNFKVIGNSFNQNSQCSLVVNGRGLVIGNSFETGPAATNTVHVISALNLFTGNSFSDTRTDISILVDGSLNQFVGNVFYANGGVSMVGSSNIFNDNRIDQTTMLGGGYWLVMSNNNMAQGNHWSGHDYLGSGPPAVHVVALYGDNVQFINNSCREWTGKTFVRVENATAIFQPNFHDGTGTDGTTGIVGSYGSPILASVGALTLPYGFNVFHISGVTNITSILASVLTADRVVTLIFDGILTVVDTNNLKINGAFVTAAGAQITLACDGLNWTEVGRCTP